MVQVREVERIRTLGGSLRIVEVRDDDGPLADEPVDVIEPLLGGRRERLVTDARGRIAFEQRDEESGELPAPRSFEIEARGVRYFLT